MVVMALNSGANSDAGTTDEIDEFFKTILNSKKLHSQIKQEIEQIAKVQTEERSRIEEARTVAAEQARKTYKCEVCSLDFLGILAFAEHDGETAHMSNRGKKINIGGH